MTDEEALQGVGVEPLPVSRKIAIYTPNVYLNDASVEQSPLPTFESDVVSIVLDGLPLNSETPFWTDKQFKAMQLLTSVGLSLIDSYILIKTFTNTSIHDMSKTLRVKEVSSFRKDARRISSNLKLGVNINTKISKKKRKEEIQSGEDGNDVYISIDAQTPEDVQDKILQLVEFESVRETKVIKQAVPAKKKQHRQAAEVEEVEYIRLGFKDENCKEAFEIVSKSIETDLMYRLMVQLETNYSNKSLLLTGEPISRDVISRHKELETIVIKDLENLLSHISDRRTFERLSESLLEMGKIRASRINSMRQKYTQMIKDNRENDFLFLPSHGIDIMLQEELKEYQPEVIAFHNGDLMPHDQLLSDIAEALISERSEEEIKDIIDIGIYKMIAYHVIKSYIHEKIESENEQNRTMIELSINENHNLSAEALKLFHRFIKKNYEIGDEEFSNIVRELIESSISKGMSFGLIVQESILDLLN